MNCVRVNMLKKSEQRYQGAVSRRFMLVVAVVTPIVIIALLSGVKLIQYTSIKYDLKASREIWGDLEPRLELYKNENRGLVTNNKLLSLFDEWKNAQAPIEGLLTDLQNTVPANIQLTRLSIRSKQTAARYDAAEDMELTYELAVDGISQGDRAEEEVIHLPQSLAACEHYAATFDSLKLSSMRKLNSRSEINKREFKLVSEQSSRR